MARQNVMLRDDQAGVTCGTGFTSQTYGTPEGYRTVVTANYTLPAIAGGASLGVGLAALTLPAGERQVTGSKLNIAIKQTQGNITADTPEVGLGTTIASGANATLGAVGAAAENIMEGVVAADCNGTATVGNVNTNLVIATASSHIVYLNVADGWAASGDTAAAISGTFEVFWR